MIGIRSAFAVLCLGAVCASAYSQQYAIDSSYNTIGINVGSYMTVSVSGYIVYPLTGTYQVGNASVSTSAYGNYGGYAYAHNQAFAGPGYGFGSIGYGFEEYLTISNEDPYGGEGYFTFYSTVFESISTSENGIADDFGGFQEFGGSDFEGFNTIEQGGLGAPYDFAYHFSVTYTSTAPGYSFTVSQGEFSDGVASGQSIRIGFWASGITQASSPAAVPSPVAVAPFALGLLGALRRRNKKS